MNEASREPVEQNLRLAPYIAQKYRHSGVEMEDLVSIAYVGLVKASSLFDPERGAKFTSFAGRCIQREILMELRRLRKRKGKEVSLDEPLRYDIDEQPLTLSDILGSASDSLEVKVEEADMVMRARQAIEKLPGRQRDAMTLRCLFGLTQADIARHMGISQPLVSRNIKRGTTALRAEVLRA